MRIKRSDIAAISDCTASKNATTITTPTSRIAMGAHIRNMACALRFPEQMMERRCSSIRFDSDRKRVERLAPAYVNNNHNKKLAELTERLREVQLSWAVT